MQIAAAAADQHLSLKMLKGMLQEGHCLCSICDKGGMMQLAGTTVLLGETVCAMPVAACHAELLSKTAVPSRLEALCTFGREHCGFTTHTDRKYDVGICTTVSLLE